MPTSPARLPRIDLRILLLSLALWPGASTWADDALRGRDLFLDTPNASGLDNLTGPCTSCHTSVENRRIAIGGSAYADITFDSALSRFLQAIQNRAPMNQFGQLADMDKRDIATYLADTPKTSAAQLDFTPSGTNTMTAPQSVDLRHAIATGETLQVVSVAIGAGGTGFSRSADMCNQQTLNAGASCRVSVTFTASDTANHSAPLTFTLRQGAGSNPTFTRTVTLNGAVQVASTPPPAAGNDTSSGGGALDWTWAAGLALAIVALRRLPPSTGWQAWGGAEQSGHAPTHTTTCLQLG